MKTSEFDQLQSNLGQNPFLTISARLHSYCRTNGQTSEAQIHQPNLPHSSHNCPHIASISLGCGQNLLV
jgi:hypothetical protein